MRSVICLSLAFAMGMALSASALEVTLTVEEPIGAARAVETVSGGIPLPQGTYKDPAAFSLFDGGTEVPVQLSPIVKYPDGSLHWVLVSFPVKADAKSKKTYTLKDDSVGKAKPKNPVVVKESGDVVEVSNGIVSFKINKGNFNGFESVTYKGKEVFKAAKAGLAANDQGGGKPTHFEYRYKGPVRTTIYMKGTYGDQKAPTWAMAVTLNADESAIHIDHNLRNGGKGAGKVQVKGAKLCLGVAGTLEAGEHKEGAAGGKGSPAWGCQAFSGAADVLVFIRCGGPGKPLHKAEVADGELAVHMGMGAGDFEINYGAHKLSEIDIVFGKTATPEALCEPLHAVAPSAWYSEHDGMGVGRGFGSLEDETAAYKNAGWTGFDNPKKFPHEKPNPNIYKSWFDAHGTSECDQMRGLTVGYVRTGQRGFLDRAHAWARYWQTYFLYRSDDLIYGKDMTYKTSKWGKGRCCTEGCHFYVSGLFNYALLTGDIDALEAAFDGAEFGNTGWFGQYSGKKPGASYSSYGCRAFSRCYCIVARAYDVARDEQWKSAIMHFAQMALKTPMRDQRGFTYGRSMSSVGNAKGKSKHSPAVPKMIEEQKIDVSGKLVKHPVYGEYLPKCAGTWPAAMLSWANYQTWEALKDDPDPAAQLVAEDVKDMAISIACFGEKYAYSREQGAVYYYIMIDYPIPDYVPIWQGEPGQKFKTDSWYTKWWPNTMAQGYLLTGDERFKKTMYDIYWAGMGRVYVQPTRLTKGEAPKYAWISTNTKGDWISPTALAIGVGAHPRKDAKPPKAVADLAGKSSGGGKVELSWTAPADEGGGTVSRYWVKWAEQPIKDFLDIDYIKEKGTVTYWNMAKNVLGEPKPGKAGAKEKMTLEGLPAGKTLYFTVRSEDGEPNWSAVSNACKVEVK